VTTTLITTTSAPTSPAPSYYSDLDAAGVASARATTDRVRGLIHGSNKVLFAIGRELIAMKALLRSTDGHGHFGDWIAAELRITARTAQNYMNAAAAFSDMAKCEIVSHLKPTTVYALAAPSTPATVRDGLMKRLEDGERLTDAEIVREVKSAKVKPAAASVAAAAAAPAAVTAAPDPKASAAARAAQAEDDAAVARIAAILKRGISAADLREVRSIVDRLDCADTLDRALERALDEVKPTPANDEPSADEVAAALAGIEDSDDSAVIEGEFEVVAESTDEALEIEDRAAA